jgi:hypothetical protein
MAQSAQVGHNDNVVYRGQNFHLQTEDSGLQHPHIITHLFMDDGRILKSQKCSYEHLRELQGSSEQIRLMMREQHQSMFIKLRQGEFDSLIAHASIIPASTPTTTGAATTISPGPTTQRQQQPSFSELPPLPPPRMVSSIPVSGRYEKSANELPTEAFKTNPRSDQSLNALILSYLKEDLK